MPQCGAGRASMVWVALAFFGAMVVFGVLAVLVFAIVPKAGG